MAKTNKFRVKKLEENKITVEEERKDRSPFLLFFRRNGKLIFAIALLFSLTVFIIAIALAVSNIKDSSVVIYESNGVVVKFDGTDNSILNGTPITKEYASIVFDNQIQTNKSNTGVVIKLKEVVLKDRIIVFYSDKTVLVKYNNGNFLKVSSVNNNYGISEEGIIDRKALTKELTGNVKNNTSLGISVLYLSDGSLEVSKGNTTFFVRNSDITNNNNNFYTNLSGVSLPVKKENNKVYYSDNIVKENNYIIENNKKYNIKEEKNIHDNIKIIYYENGYAEVIKDDLSIIVKKSEHITYDEHIFEIIDNSLDTINIKDIMDIKNINLENTNTEKIHYIVVLEETNNYNKYNIDKRLANEFINYNIYVGGNKINNNILNHNLKETNYLQGLSTKNNSYLLYEGNLDKLSTTEIKIGMWVSYEDITNEYMNSAFIGTVKVYVESLK